MNLIRAIYGAFVLQLKITTVNIGSFSFLLEAIPMVAVLAWVATQSDNVSVLTYLMVGAPLMAIWNGMIFRAGWSLNNELFGHTLDFAIISRTPVIAMLFGKTLAQVFYGIPSGLAALFTMFLITRQLPEVASLPLLIVSLFLVIISLAIAGLAIAPFMVLVGGRAGFFNAIIPFGAVLSGFIFPITRLPIGLEVIARLIPTSWAMDGVWQAINGPDSFWSIAGTWGACILTSVFLLIISCLMFKVVEKRIRVTGILSAY
jgi:ABC-2 type transport system permease protein